MIEKDTNTGQSQVPRQSVASSLGLANKSNNNDDGFDPIIPILVGTSLSTSTAGRLSHDDEIAIRTTSIEACQKTQDRKKQETCDTEVARSHRLSALSSSSVRQSDQLGAAILNRFDDREIDRLEAGVGRISDITMDPELDHGHTECDDKLVREMHPSTSLRSEMDVMGDQLQGKVQRKGLSAGILDESYERHMYIGRETVGREASELCDSRDDSHSHGDPDMNMRDRFLLSLRQVDFAMLYEVSGEISVEIEELVKKLVSCEMQLELFHTSHNSRLSQDQVLLDSQIVKSDNPVLEFGGVERQEEESCGAMTAVPDGGGGGGGGGDSDDPAEGAISTDGNSGPPRTGCASEKSNKSEQVSEPCSADSGSDNGRRESRRENEYVGTDLTTTMAIDNEVKILLL